MCKPFASLIDQFFNHTNIRKYKAVIKGVLANDEGIIEKPIGRDKNNRFRMAIDNNGKEAGTYYKVLKKYNNYTYIECELFTGRTHQIRVNMKDMGHPLLGDFVYGKVDKNFRELSGQVLHVYYLRIKHPRTNEDMEFSSELTEYFVNVLKKLYEI